VNRLNDLFDYFYVKQADMSRIYGMELEHLLSPNKINYLVKGGTLVEEHIQGIPGDTFIKKYLSRHDYNPLRVAKEFVKFNERSLVQLVGDMRNDNFLVEVIPDFDELYFRLRAIDFDQFAFEGGLKIYMPQFFKENSPIVKLGVKSMSAISELQYQQEERARIATRAKGAGEQLLRLMQALRTEDISTNENVSRLRSELADFYEDAAFEKAQTMGDLLFTSLQMLDRYPVRKRRSRKVE
jgi:hypothetical protein